MNEPNENLRADIAAKLLAALISSGAEPCKDEDETVAQARVRVAVEQSEALLRKLRIGFAKPCPPKPAAREGQSRMPLIIGAYTPQGEEHPVLVPCIPGPFPGDGVALGPVIRRGDVLYSVLVNSCDSKPVWLYHQKPQAL